MKDKKTIILIALTLGALGSLIYGMTADPVVKKSASSAQAPLDNPTNSSAHHSIDPMLPDVNIHTELTRVQEQRPRSEFKNWGRNPFDVIEDKLSVSAIAWSIDKPRAFINGNVLYEGDLIQDKVILQIFIDHVILKDADSIVRLDL
ncbi:MAG: hypothetical protein ACI9CF_000590 [Candidatus Omnitrophota bacterium]|jgi:hypothetical protein